MEYNIIETFGMVVVPPNVYIFNILETNLLSGVGDKLYLDINLLRVV